MAVDLLIRGDLTAEDFNDDSLEGGHATPSEDKRQFGLFMGIPETIVQT